MRSKKILISKNMLYQYVISLFLRQHFSYSETLRPFRRQGIFCLSLRITM
ncbi:hypothetical protein DESPIG_02564 [Desulfovibrio piger ATCC 29098]|uniref:Uncharacterized protein n=1 Tax=Desulfovibrio piger ATCC 29098 TaxID=411464 RepID=B6WWU3_9BACT|nr:hypothetical protein DESPIG_02564 [Desulfovibrio piger ATCC 29098]